MSTPLSVLDRHRGDPEARVHLLSRHEQELLARILQHAENLSAGSAELLPLVQTAMVRAVGELLLLRSAEETATEIVEILKKQGPHPPKGEPLRDDGPHPPKPPGPGDVPLPGPHPPKPPGPGQVPLTGPHPPKPPGPGQVPLTGPHPPKPPGPGQVPLTGPHPPKPPGPGQVQPTKKPLSPKPPAKAPVAPPAGPHPPKPPHPPGPGATPSHKANAAVPAIPAARELRAVVASAEEFLMPSELRELMRFTLAHEQDFALSEVVSPGVQGQGTIDAEYRRSRVLMQLGVHEQRMLERIRGMLPLVFRKLDMEPFDPARAELQITASNDGDFFHDHSDNGHPEIASRALTFVYFFHEEPKPFHGGELRVYNSRFNGDYWVRQGAGKVIVPEQNQMVFFPSDLVHEITPVICRSGGFGQSRFTVNGWLHRR